MTATGSQSEPIYSITLFMMAAISQFGERCANQCAALGLAPLSILYHWKNGKKRSNTSGPRGILKALSYIPLYGRLPVSAKITTIAIKNHI